MRTKTLIGCCAAATLFLAACGSDKETSSTTSVSATTGSGSATTAAGTSTGSSTATSSGGAAPATAAPSAADPSLSPVVVGFHNLEGGAVSLPDVRVGFEEGIKYVNEELGGLNGHPLKVESCNVDVTPESSVNCANQFVESNVVVAIQGIDYAADAALPVLKGAGIAEVAFFPFTPSINTSAGDAFVTLFSQQDGYAADLIAEQEFGSKNEAMLLADLPASHAVIDEVVQPAAQKLGMKVTPFYFPTQTDWTTFAATVLASNPDAVSLPAAAEQDCLGAVPALRAAGFDGPILASSCLTLLDKLDSDTLKNVHFNAQFYYPNMVNVPAKAQRDLEIFDRFMKRDAPDTESISQALLGFHIAVTAADMLRQVKGDVTAQNVKQTLPTTKGDSFFREDGYDCSKPTWPGTTACGTGLIMTSVTSDKRLEVTDFSPIDVSSVRPPG